MDRKPNHLLLSEMIREVAGITNRHDQSFAWRICKMALQHAKIDEGHDEIVAALQELAKDSLPGFVEKEIDPLVVEIQGLAKMPTVGGSGISLVWSQLGSG